MVRYNQFCLDRMVYTMGHLVIKDGQFILEKKVCHKQQVGHPVLILELDSYIFKSGQHHTLKTVRLIFLNLIGNCEMMHLEEKIHYHVKYVI